MTLPPLAAALSAPRLRRILPALLLALLPAASAHAATVTVTIAASPANLGLTFTVDGATYTNSQSFSWTVGSSHTLAVTSPQAPSGTETGAEYAFSSWSDGGAQSHTVTASAGATSYSVSFATDYELQISVSPSGDGTVTPATPTYYGAGSIVTIQATTANHVFKDWTGSNDIADSSSEKTTITMNAPETIEAVFKSGMGIQYITPPTFIVSTTADDPAGMAGNCPIGGPSGGAGLSCTLRDALAAVVQNGSGTVTFSSSVFASSNTAAQNTITLTAGSLAIPSAVVIEGPLLSQASGQTPLVTVSGGGAGSDFPIFTVASTVTQATILGLNLTNGNSSAISGTAIANAGHLTVNQCTISGNTSPPSGGAVGNSGTLELEQTTISGNTGSGLANTGSLLLVGDTIADNTAPSGAGLLNSGSAAVEAGTFSGNSATSGDGGAISNLSGTLSLADSTISGNAAAGGSGGGVSSSATLNITNSIVSGNSAASSVDIDGAYIDGGGNQISVSAIQLAPLGNYGGITQTMIPLPGSPAICGAIISSATASDQRGMARTTTYGPSQSCQDAGAVQTDYALSFTAQPAPVPPATAILTGVDFQAAATLTESGSPFSFSVAVPLALSGPGSLSGGSAITANGLATWSALQITAPGANDELIARFSTPPSLSVTSAPFSVLGVTAITLTSSTSNANLNASLTLIASVTSSSGIPSGSVTFFDGSTSLGDAPLNGRGVATLTTSSLAAGMHALTAVYDGGGLFAGSTSAVLTQTVTAPDFTLSANPASASVAAGHRAKTTITFSPVGGFTGTISFACSSLPAEAACNFSPGSLTADGSNTGAKATLTITTNGSPAASAAWSPATGASAAPLLAGIFFVPGFLACLACERRRPRTRSRLWLLPLLLVMAAFFGVVGCGSTPQVAPGSYHVTVTATPSPGATTGVSAQTLTFTLTVTH